MKTSWLKYLNPFHFEVRILFWMIWVNGLIALLLLPLIFFIVAKFQPLEIRLSNLTDLPVGRFDKVADITKLREMLQTQISSEHIVWMSAIHLSESVAFLLASLTLGFFFNAIYFYKAHRLLKPNG